MGRSNGREQYEARMNGVDAATKLTMLMGSPYSKHRKRAKSFEDTLRKMQELVKAQGESDVVSVQADS